MLYETLVHKSIKPPTSSEKYIECLFDIISIDLSPLARIFSYFKGLAIKHTPDTILPYCIQHFLNNATKNTKLLHFLSYLKLYITSKLT